MQKKARKQLTVNCREMRFLWFHQIDDSPNTAVGWALVFIKGLVKIVFYRLFTWKLTKTFRNALLHIRFGFPLRVKLTAQSNGRIEGVRMLTTNDYETLHRTTSY